MSDTTVARSNHVAQAHGVADQGVSRATLDQMKAGEVNPGDAKAAEQMDFAKIKALVDKMQQLQLQHHNFETLDKMGSSMIRGIKG